jgi:hypothetical protein
MIQSAWPKADKDQSKMQYLYLLSFSVRLYSVQSSWVLVQFFTRKIDLYQHCKEI